MPPALSYKTTPEIRGAILALHDSGKNMKQIAEQLQLNKKTVSLWVNR